MRFRQLSVIAAGAALAGFIAPASWAQQSELPPSGQQSEPDSDTLGESAPTNEAAQPGASQGAAQGATIDENKLNQFADAYLAVQTIQQKAASDMEAAQDPAAAEKVRTTAESDMIAAVERNGLQVEEFNRIVQTMASDVDMRNRVAAKLQERSGQ